ncbi:hypothetical protein FH608_045165 [Nonomuraea phyllanthi]|uniref:Uncharacterized protein n=1 Tax=Nonomuraea phyllanthi TaxID=2219224 RepID=A0A5C4V984_9ACTN|nr:hypothetical protein [Nonomuraea phyllanthi]KAB8188321.1 hypothetical protein FH608_045165 [Nonomuraea phyllanthi]QFY08341.1 hypothetical protein GBF35_18140 [Nonomuraea phyllanthi]
MANNVFDLAELRKLIDEQAAVPPRPPEETPVEHEALTFPPVLPAPDAELAAAVPRVPLVADAIRLTTWTGTRPVTPEGHLSEQDAEAAARELGLTPARLRLIWIVAVNTGLLRILGGRASRGPLSLQLTVEATLEFWDGVVMDVLDRADEGLTGSAVVDGHLAEMLATIYSVRSGVATANLARGILQSHEVACAPGAVEMRRLAAALPAELLEALSLLTYCGLVEQTPAGRTALTPLGVWAIRRDLLREGHDAPTTAEVEVFADLSAAELVEALVKGSATQSAVAGWLERRSPESAARDLIEIAASGTAGQRGAVGAILEELGPEAEQPVRQALDDPLMRRYAASWLHIRDLPAPTLSPEDHTWIAVDSLAALMHLSGPAAGRLDTPEPGEDLIKLVGEMPEVGHPDTIAVLEMLAAAHDDQAVVKAARKAAMKARSLEHTKLG